MHDWAYWHILMAMDSRQNRNLSTAVFTALKRLTVGTAAENGQMFAVCILELTAAFDTVEHEVLLIRLERQ